MLEATTRLFGVNLGHLGNRAGVESRRSEGGEGTNRKTTVSHNKASQIAHSLSCVAGCEDVVIRQGKLDQRPTRTRVLMVKSGPWKQIEWNGSVCG